jgi:aspartyl-tRNA synthetase
MPQNVIMVMDKVDGTYVNESKNAFTRFVSENLRGQTITVTKTAVDKDISLLVFASFENADAAMQFLGKIRKAAPDEVSWLPANKYSFLIISDDNLQLLQLNKNLKEYKDLLNKQYPGKF